VNPGASKIFFVTLKSLIRWEMAVGRPLATAAGAGAAGGLEQTIVRFGLRVLVIGGLLVAGIGVGRAYDRDETVLTVQVSSADHELEEGYFSLGDKATLMVKPGSDLYRFLSRQRGRKVKILLQESGGPELSRLER
jgi:hypothetical protein